MKNIKSVFKKIKFNKVIRIALGSAIAFAICHRLGLKNASSSAVIVLLSIQDTGRDTFKEVIKRIFSYFFSMTAAIVLFTYLGSRFEAFFLFMLVLTALTYLFGWSSTLSSSTVVASHFLTESNYGGDFVFSEILLLAIGTVIAMISNIFIYDDTKTIKKDIKGIDEGMKTLLKKLSLYIKGDITSEDEQEETDSLLTHIENSRQKAINSIKNVSDASSHYYIDYVDMRESQRKTIMRIKDDLVGLSEGTPLPLKEDVISVIEDIADTIDRRDSYLTREHLIQALRHSYNRLPIPQTKDELENTAILRDVISELEFFVELRENFIKKLTEEQLKKYYTE